jgi:hypothetical protein
MAGGDADVVLERVKQGLDGTPYACSSLRPLTGGNCNFIYRGVLRQALPDGTREVLVKHGEGYVASAPEFRITTARCVRRDLSAKRPLVPEACSYPVLTNS